MKKFMYKTACIALGVVLCHYGIAQPPPPPVPKQEAGDKNDQSEVIIRQKGDKDSKIVLEIKNGEFFVNGKPLEKFDDENIIVEKHELEEDGPGMYSPFRSNSWNNEEMEGMRNDNDNKQRSIHKSVRIRMNAAFLGVSSRKTETGGATVLEITGGSPAEKAGLKKGDVITKVNEIKITNPDSLFQTVHNFKPGDKIKITYTRDGKEQTTFATLEKAEYKPNDFNYNYNYDYQMPPMPDIVMPPMPDMKGLEFGYWGNRQPKIGIKAQDAEDGKGVNVLEVGDSSAAAKAGLKKGDIILQFDGTEINSTNQLMEQIQAARQKPMVKVKILRNGVSQEIEIKIPRKLKTAEL
jgi:serine protease Do